MNTLTCFRFKILNTKTCDGIVTERYYIPKQSENDSMSYQCKKMEKLAFHGHGLVILCQRIRVASMENGMEFTDNTLVDTFANNHLDKVAEHLVGMIYNTAKHVPCYRVIA